MSDAIAASPEGIFVLGTVEGVGNASYRIASPGFVPVSMSLAGREPGVHDVVLSRAASCTVVVTDLEGQPIADAQVMLSTAAMPMADLVDLAVLGPTVPSGRQGVAVARTDGRGVATVEGIESGACLAIAYRWGYFQVGLCPRKVLVPGAPLELRLTKVLAKGVRVVGEHHALQHNLTSPDSAVNALAFYEWGQVLAKRHGLAFVFLYAPNRAESPLPVGRSRVLRPGGFAEEYHVKLEPLQPEGPVVEDLAVPITRQRWPSGSRSISVRDANGRRLPTSLVTLTPLDRKRYFSMHSKEGEELTVPYAEYSITSSNAFVRGALRGTRVDVSPGALDNVLELVVPAQLTLVKFRVAEVGGGDVASATLFVSAGGLTHTCYPGDCWVPDVGLMVRVSASGYMPFERSIAQNELEGGGECLLELAPVR